MATNKYRSLFNKLVFRFKSPWAEPAFLFYFIITVCVIGPAGIWTALVPSTLPNCVGQNALSNMATYFISLSVASCLSFVNINKKDEEIRDDNSIIYVAVLIGLIQAILFFLAVFLKRNRLIPAIFGLVISLLIWIIANSDNKEIVGIGYDDKMRAKTKQLTGNWQNQAPSTTTDPATGQIHSTE